MRTRLFGLVVSALLLSMNLCSIAKAQNLKRLASQFRRFDGLEDFTSSMPPGIPIYTKIVDATDPLTSVLYVSMHATTDETVNNAQALFSCNITSSGGVTSFCNPGSTFSLGIPGWLMLQKYPFSGLEAENNVNYTWCTRVTPDFYTVQLRMATNMGGSVFLEALHVEIDSLLDGGKDPTQCTEGVPIG